MTEKLTIWAPSHNFVGLRQPSFSALNIGTHILVVSTLHCPIPAVCWFPSRIVYYAQLAKYSSAFFHSTSLIWTEDRRLLGDEVPLTSFCGSAPGSQ